MREIVLDTETTGFEPQEGHRIVEIGAVELWNHLATGKTYHQYINPQRSMPAEAFAVHGLGDDFLKNKPTFSKIADDFLEFVGNDILVIHNAKFDVKFLNAELDWCHKPKIVSDRAIDTLQIARQKFPGSPASLDALCRRFAIDSASRTLHGALLDSEILAEVYLELIGGRQPDFGLSQVAPLSKTSLLEKHPTTAGKRPRNLASRLTSSELEAHRAFIKEMGEDAIWNRVGLTPKT
jgi:DNA polymerase III subunit epsilon